ncbi:MAG: hypothetical protein AcusKO_47410 [Acuticoccus sp.]
MRLMDQAASPGRVLTDPAEITSPAFQAFATGILAELPAKLDACLTGGEPILIDIVHSPLVAADDTAADSVMPSPDAAGDGCQLASPWAQLSPAGGRPHARFVLSERQILADQTLLADPDAAVAEALPSFTQAAFEHLAQRYADLALTGAPDDTTLAGEIPAELLWLFRRSPQTTLFPFADGARGAMATLTHDTAPSYVSLILALVDRCTKQNGSDAHYPTVTSVKNLIGSDFKTN